MDAEGLYQDILLDHFRHPRHARSIAETEAVWTEKNPMCGDLIRLWADLSTGRVTGLVHDTKGCAISVASASIMADWLQDMPVPEVLERIKSFRELLTGHDPAPQGLDPSLAALLTVRRFPMRLKCALLPWTAFEKWLKKK